MSIRVSFDEYLRELPERATALLAEHRFVRVEVEGGDLLVDDPQRIEKVSWTTTRDARDILFEVDIYLIDGGVQSLIFDQVGDLCKIMVQPGQPTQPAPELAVLAPWRGQTALA